MPVQQKAVMKIVPTWEGVVGFEHAWDALKPLAVDGPLTGVNGGLKSGCRFMDNVLIGHNTFSAWHGL